MSARTQGRKKEESNWIKSVLNWCSGSLVRPSDIQVMSTVIKNGREIDKAAREGKKAAIAELGKARVEEIRKQTQREMYAKYGIRGWLACLWL